MSKKRQNEGPVIDAKFEDIKDEIPVETEEAQTQDTQQPDPPVVNTEPEKDPWYKAAPKAVWGFTKKHKKKIVAGAAIVGGVIGALFTLDKVAESKGYKGDSTEGDTDEYLPEPEESGESYDSSESSGTYSEETVAE